MSSQERGFHWDLARISSQENLIADSASRLREVPDWSLCEKVFRKVYNRWGTPDVDLMASNESRKRPVFFSWSRKDNEAWGIDSLAQDVEWNLFELPYCFPPFPLLQQVLEKCRSQKVKRMILIAPLWAGKPFFPALLDLLIDCRRIQVSSRMVVDLATGSPPPDLHRLRLVACLISGRSDTSPLISQNQQKHWLKHHGVALPKRDMEQPGDSGSSGVACKEYRLLRLL